MVLENKEVTDTYVPKRDDANVMEVAAILQEFDSVQTVMYNLLCNNCKKGIKASKHDVVKCEYCLATQRARSLRKQVLVRVKAAALRSESYVFDAVDLVPFLPYNSVDFNVDQDELIKNVMEMSNFRVAMKENHTIEILPASGDREAEVEAQPEIGAHQEQCVKEIQAEEKLLMSDED